MILQGFMLNCINFMHPVIQAKVILIALIQCALNSLEQHDWAPGNGTKTPTGYDFYLFIDHSDKCVWVFFFLAVVVIVLSLKNIPCLNIPYKRCSHAYPVLILHTSDIYPVLCCLQ